MGFMNQLRTAQTDSGSKTARESCPAILVWILSAICWDDLPGCNDIDRAYNNGAIELEEVDRLTNMLRQRTWDIPERRPGTPDMSDIQF